MRSFGKNRYSTGIQADSDKTDKPSKLAFLQSKVKKTDTTNLSSRAEHFGKYGVDVLLEGEKQTRVSLVS